MASNSFGTLLRMTTWGESHGPAIGVVIDGVPAGLEISETEINQALAERAPGNNPHTSPRKEKDRAQILSGIFEGKTTGAPVSIIIWNRDADSSQYDQVKQVYRPGHANFTYLEKYGIFDYRGGGRASARETACRVAAGAIAKKLLSQQGIQILGYMQAIGTTEASIPDTLEAIKHNSITNPLRCPDTDAATLMQDALTTAQEDGDSMGGIIECQAHHLPTGLGDPVYEKLEAKLASAMMSIPASKGFEVGLGFQASRLRGSEHNDAFTIEQQQTQLASNQAGGTLGGISSGAPLRFRVAFKPTSSIKKPQQTVTTGGEKTTFTLPENARHDPCVAIRAIPIVEAMCALVLADCLLLNQSARLER